MFKRPLFPVATAFATGILLTGAFSLPLPIGAAGLGFACLCAAARRKNSLAILFAVAALGMVSYTVHTAIPPDDVSTFLYSRASGVAGRVISDVDLRSDRAMFPLEVTAVEVSGRTVPASGRLMVTCYRPDDLPDWQPPQYGDVLSIRSRISRPGTGSNPGDFSWRDYLARQRIHAVTYVRSPEQVKTIARRPSNPAVVLALWMKERVAHSIASALPPDEAAVVTGMDLGTYTTLPDRLLANFQRTGTLHLLAASGFNCAVLIVVFGYILARILKLPKRIINPTLILILIIYMLMVGAKPSIVRATIMAAMLLFGSVLNRPADTLNLLFGAAIVILAINPADIFDIGFQLSFAAVLALVMVLPAIEETIRKWRLQPNVGSKRGGLVQKATVFIAREGWQGITATAAATLGTLPLTAHYFNYVSLTAIIVNAVVAATVLPIFVIGLLLPLVSWIPILGKAVALLGTGITRFSLASINWFGELPNSCLTVQSPGIYGVAGYYLILAAGLKYVYSKLPAKKRTRGD